MLHLIPAPLHRQLYRIADWLRRRWWRVRRSRRSSVFVLAHDADLRVLLVRHSYGRPIWALPGGGIARNEDPLTAAAREFREELACEIEALRPLVTSEEAHTGSVDLQHVFVARLAGTPVPDMREVIEARTFAVDALPENVGWLTMRRIVAWQDQLQQR